MPDPLPHPDAPREIQDAAVVVPTSDLEGSLAFFRDRLGFELVSIFPADDPREAALAGHGLKLVLRVGAAGPPGTLRLTLGEPGGSGKTGSLGSAPLIAPDGTHIELVDPPLAPAPPSTPPTFLVSRRRSDSPWKRGRAGMRYRDLIPGRQDGRIIASHIAIEQGGPVPDYVHHHGVTFQMIYCLRGWVRVAYQDQGAPLRMEPGDCVLQPPGIRHRVLECSDGLEVVEFTTPAEHPTFTDSAIPLPSEETRPGRRYGGQRFQFSRADNAAWQDSDATGLQIRDLGMADATAGVAAARVFRGSGTWPPNNAPHRDTLHAHFVLCGPTTLVRPDGTEVDLATGDTFVVPPDTPFALRGGAPSSEVLAVELRRQG